MAGPLGCKGRQKKAAKEAGSRQQKKKKKKKNPRIVPWKPRPSAARWPVYCPKKNQR
ncbi:hypothetical protein QG37_04317 [Candidozyma auris]|nr:hypothetical protein QG37_04317 [[Candida] auris]